GGARPARLPPDPREAAVVVPPGRQLDVDESDVDRRPRLRRQRLSRLGERGHRGDHVRGAGLLQELDEIAPRRPFVLDDEHPQGHGSATIARVPAGDESMRNVDPLHSRARRRRTSRRPRPLLSRRGSKPGPSSATTTSIPSSVRRGRTTPSPPPSPPSAPCPPALSPTASPPT